MGSQHLWMTLMDSRTFGGCDFYQKIYRPSTWQVLLAKMGNQKVVIKIIDKVCYHGKTVTFHNNKGTDHGMVGKAFANQRFWE